MYRKLLELLKLVKPHQPHLPQTNVSGRSEQLVCPTCGSFAIETTHNHQHDCFDCGESWLTN